MLEKEFQYFIDNQNELLKKYNGRFIAIVGEQVVGDYDSFDMAIDETLKEHELGTFLVQECVEGEKAYTQTFHSRVVFA